ncbi:ABC transporter substrate-binding protein [Mesorhizobium sp. ANAO-SY3R2]|uniref:ABC transporter substrate-binding protein n=1 Tax=Mesorhizobium sp. ANAO-SY3R2 TaxID=3166644 RepID=UPI00366A5BB3
MALAVILSQAALAQDTFNIGVLTDMTGVNSDASGRGSVVAAQMAVDDFGDSVLGRKIVVLSADSQNKADIASVVTREWIDKDNVKAIFDVPITSIALAALEVAKTRNVALLSSGAASSDMTGKYCSEVYAHWTYDTFALASGTARAMTLEGNKDWYFLTADYTFGYNLERDATTAVQAAGGTIVGSVRHPRETPDMTSFLLQAQGSGAKTIALANSTADFSLAVKQAAELGMSQSGFNIAALLATIADIDGLGLDVAQGLVLTEAFYWDMDDRTREWSDRFAKEMEGRRPTMIQAGVYSAVLNYLKAVEASGLDGGKEVIAKLRTMPIDDMFARNAKLREDGLMQHDMYLLRVKKPSESNGRWDYYNLVRTIPGEEAFRPLSQSECPLIKK